ncbi:hypothetical protein LZ31DRAFT_213521 [Colletotrichum somersetense]|nr:hypothetical protein LZ31DRAFT_213521 [Colletotrichum somersetense]
MPSCVFGQSAVTISSHAFSRVEARQTTDPDCCIVGQREGEKGRERSPRRAAGPRRVREIHRRRRESCTTPPTCPGPHTVVKIREKKKPLRCPRFSHQPGRWTRPLTFWKNSATAKAGRKENAYLHRSWGGKYLWKVGRHARKVRA